MLVCGRQEGQEVFIDLPAGYVVPPEGVRIVVRAVRTGRLNTRIGFICPRDFKILRAELIEPTNPEREALIHAGTIEAADADSGRDGVHRSADGAYASWGGRR